MHNRPVYNNEFFEKHDGSNVNSLLNELVQIVDWSESSDKY